MSIPAQLLVHTAIVDAETPFELSCYSERGDDEIFDPQDSGLLVMRIVANPDDGATPIPPGAKIALRGHDLVVIKVEDLDDGGITGLAHREILALDSGSLAEARARAEALMTATLNIERPTGGTVYDPVEHKDVTVYNLIYTGPGQLQPASNTQPQIRDLAGQEINSIVFAGSVLLGADPAPNDRVTVAASADLRQVGQQFTILGVESSSMPTCRRFAAVLNEG